MCKSIRLEELFLIQSKILVVMANCLWQCFSSIWLRDQKWIASFCEEKKKTHTEKSTVQSLFQAHTENKHKTGEDTHRFIVVINAYRRPKVKQPFGTTVRQQLSARLTECYSGWAKIKKLQANRRNAMKWNETQCKSGERTTSELRVDNKFILSFEHNCQFKQEAHFQCNIPNQCLADRNDRCGFAFAFAFVFMSTVRWFFAQPHTGNVRIRFQHYKMYIKHVRSPKSVDRQTKIKAIATIFRSANYFIYFIRMVWSFATSVYCESGIVCIWLMWSARCVVCACVLEIGVVCDKRKFMHWNTRKFISTNRHDANARNGK